jgi:uncharacterized protein YciI
MRFLYFYLMAEDPVRVHQVAPQHAAYWQSLVLPGYLGGPFADRSGGLITFEADNPAQAEQLVRDDPFVGEGLLSSWWLEHWLAEPADATMSPTGRP